MRATWASMSSVVVDPPPGRPVTSLRCGGGHAEEARDSRYELITCSWKGHALVGTDAGEVTEADATFVRQGASGPVVPVPAL